MQIMAITVRNSIFLRQKKTEKRSSEIRTRIGSFRVGRAATALGLLFPHFLKTGQEQHVAAHVLLSDNRQCT